MKRIAPIQKGDIITARRLNEYGDGVNTLLQKGVDPPKQAADAPEPGVPKEDALDLNTFVETSRTVDLVTVFDDEGTNYAEIERIVTISFANADGETLKLQFTG